MKPTTAAAQPVKARWFSENPDKAWGEKFFLIYTPIWILQTALAVVLGYGKTMGDAASLVHGLLISGPFLVVPFPGVRRSPPPRDPAGSELIPASRLARMG